MSTAELQRTRCPRCSTTVEPLQEYCLECGLRLPQAQPTALERASFGLDERHRWSAGWLVPAILGLVVTILGTGAAIAISDESQAEAAPSTATGGSRTVTDPQVTAPEPPAIAPAARATTKRPATTAPPTRPAVPRAISWPPGKRAWTIVLLSVPQGQGRAAAVRQADKARRGGLRRVGVLDASRFASLHPDYYVVFHGIFDSEAEATSALRRARGVVGGAYPREIVP